MSQRKKTKPFYCSAVAARARVRSPRWFSGYRYTRFRWRLLFAVIDAIGWILLGPVKWLRALSRRGANPPPKSILIIQLDHLGDAVLSLGLLRSLRRQYPQSRIEVVTSPWNRELLEACPAVDKVHVMARTRFARRGGIAWIVTLLRWGLRFRRILHPKQRFDLAIDVRGEFPHAVLMWLAGARRRLGWNCGGGGFLLTDSVPYMPARHEVLSREAILNRLGIKPQSDARPSLEPEETAQRWVDRQLRIMRWGSARDPQNRSPLIVVHVGAGTQAKRWPPSHWKELIGRLVVEFDARIVLVGRKGDGEAFGLTQVKDWTGRLTLQRLAALSQRGDLFIGADSGPAHLAAAVGAPIVALFSGTNDPVQWRPFSAEATVVRSLPRCSPCHLEECLWADHPCMQGLSPETVFDAVQTTLDARFLRQIPSNSRFAERIPNDAANRHVATTP